MLRNRELQFWTTVNFEVEYFLNEETVDVLTDRGKWGKADNLRNSMQYFFTECIYLTEDFSIDYRVD